MSIEISESSEVDFAGFEEISEPTPVCSDVPSIANPRRNSIAGLRRMQTESISQPNIRSLSSSTPDLVDILIKYGNNPEGIPALHYAIKQEDEAAVRLLLEHGADPHALIQPISSGVCSIPTPVFPLDFAAAAGNVKIIQLLIDHGADVNYSPEQIDETMFQSLRHFSPLYFAAKADRGETIHFLVARGAKVEPDPSDFAGVCVASELYWYNPLYVATQKGATDAFQALLDNGAKIGPLLYNRPFILHLAAQMDHSGIIQILLDRGIYVDIRNEYNYTPLMQASGESFKILLKAGANPKADNNGMDALYFIASKYDMASTKLLLDHSVDINSFRCGYSPFCAACISWNSYPTKEGFAKKEYLQFLIDRGADINAKCNGRTALSWAKQYQYNDLADWLIQRGAKE